MRLVNFRLSKFPFSMSTYRIVTTKDVARDMGISPQRVREKQRAGYFKMAKLVDPGRRNYKWWDNAAFAKYRKDYREGRKDRGKSKPKATRAHRMSQRRQEKIERLLEILRNQAQVRADEKEAALVFHDCLLALLRARYGYKPRPIFPLLEGLQALYESKWIVDYFGNSSFVSAIERLPTTPQTEQSSLNASAQ